MREEYLEVISNELELEDGIAASRHFKNLIHREQQKPNISKNQSS